MRHHHVGIHVSLPGKALLAIGARVRLLARVNQNVLPKMIFLLEGSRANVTRVETLVQRGEMGERGSMTPPDGQFPGGGGGKRLQKHPKLLASSAQFSFRHNQP